ncbi:MAG: hypothetical protein K2X66_16510 [Cyanobacteria bacterium]|nr:hypothetical protein [Cyanobacteriota bacterium]
MMDPTSPESKMFCKPQEKLENAIMVGLRKFEGIDIPALEGEFGIDFKKRYGYILDKYGAFEFFEWVGTRLKLSRDAIPICNTILAEFIGV